MQKEASVSIIIPTLNEEQTIVHLLSYLKEIAPQAELIVSDGGSADRTVALSEPHARVVHSERGRGVQMNCGAAIARGEVLWFIHADCLPHRDSLAAIKELLTEETMVGGAFRYRHDNRGWIYRISDFFSNHKNRLIGTFYGDMGIFVRRETFDELGGYKPIALMEDIDFCQRLKKAGRTKIVPLPMITSSRRWEKEGALRNIIRNWLLQLAWKTGVSIDRLAGWYYFGGESNPNRYKNSG